MSNDKRSGPAIPPAIDLPEIPDPDASTATRSVSPSPPIREGELPRPTNVTLDPPLTPAPPATGETPPGSTSEGGGKKTR